MANKLYLLLEMPERFHGDNCDRCPTTWRCHEIHGWSGACPLGTAKEAVEVNPKDEAYYHPGLGWRINGKPVTLYAVEVEK